MTDSPDGQTPGRRVNALAEIKHKLRRHREDLIVALGRTPEGRELARVNAALANLGEQPVEWVGWRPTATPRKNGRRRSVKVMVDSLLDEGPLSWSYDEILAEYDQRGEPVDAADPRGALRTAMSVLVKESVATKLDDGRFMAARFASAFSEAEAHGYHQCDSDEPSDPAK